VHVGRACVAVHADSRADPRVRGNVTRCRSYRHSMFLCCCSIVAPETSEDRKESASRFSHSSHETTADLHEHDCPSFYSLSNSGLKSPG
ncbi:hypothetical protein PENTCL1PPCAC_21914, partial [Pristionchus entomophagus]